MVTETLRALRMEPIEAAVIPFPSDETTPPVTKTYFGNLDLPGVFQMLPVIAPDPNLSCAVRGGRPWSPSLQTRSTGRPAWGSGGAGAPPPPRGEVRPTRD